MVISAGVLAGPDDERPGTFFSLSVIIPGWSELQRSTIYFTSQNSRIAWKVISSGASMAPMHERPFQAAGYLPTRTCRAVHVQAKIVERHVQRISHDDRLLPSNCQPSKTVEFVWAKDCWAKQRKRIIDMASIKDAGLLAEFSAAARLMEDAC